MSRDNCENSSVEQYREQYMREESIPGIDISQASNPQDLLAKIRNLCNENDYQPLLGRSFISKEENKDASRKPSIRVMQWNLLAQGETSADL